MPARNVNTTGRLTEPACDRSAIVKQAADAFGAAPDILVNNAAAPREWFYRGIEVNVWSAWDLTALMVPGVRERGAGWVLSVTSMAAGPKAAPRRCSTA